MLAEREPLAREAVEAMFAEIGLLVLEGDAAGLAAKVSELSADTAARGEPGRHAGPATRMPAASDGARDDAGAIAPVPSYTPRTHDAPAARALALELVHEGRRDRCLRRARRHRGPVPARLLAGARAQAPARVGGARARARSGHRAARRCCCCDAHAAGHERRAGRQSRPGCRCGRAGRDARRAGGERARGRARACSDRSAAGSASSHGRSPRCAGDAGRAADDSATSAGRSRPGRTRSPCAG